MKNKIKQIPNTNLCELPIDGKIFYSEEEDYFNVPMYCLKDTLIDDVPLNVHIAIEGPTLQYDGPTIEHEIPEFTIYKESDGNCRIAIDVQLDPGYWIYDINTTLFLFLKRELILHNKLLDPIIEDEDIINHYLSYSIEVISSTIAGAIKVANAYNENISQEIMSSIKNLPRLLLDSLKIKETSQPLGPWLIRGE